jgi:hypothetical protein
MIVFLDSGVVGLLSSPNDREFALKCQSWLFGKKSNFNRLDRLVSLVSSDLV